MRMPIDQDHPWNCLFSGAVFIAATVYLFPDFVDLKAIQFPIDKGEYSAMQVVVDSMEVEKISRRKSRRRTYDIAVTYRYDVDGRSYQGASRFGPSPFEREHEAEQTMKSLEGKKLDGWYVTEKPSMSALDAERAIGDAWKNIGVAGFVSLPALAGIAATVVGVLGLRKRLRSA